MKISTYSKIRNFTFKTPVVFGLLLFGLLMGGGLGYAFFFGGTSVNLQKGLVGWWQMDGNAQDATPNNNDGTVTEATLTTDRKGQSNKAYSFDGTNDYINIPDSTSLRITTTISGALWIKLPSSPAGSGQFFIREKTGGNGDYWFNASIGGNFGVSADGGVGGVTGTTTIVADTWYHITFTYQVNDLRLYVNGVAEGTPDTAVGAPNGVSGNPIRVGGGYPLSAPTSFRTASIDDVRIYNRILSATEALALYQSYNPGVVVSDLQKGLVGQWKMDGNAQGATPNNNDGTVTGATLTTDRKAQSNKAYSFNGTSDLINVNKSGLPNPLADYTVSLWALWNDSGPDTLVFNDRFNTIDANIGIGTTDDIGITTNRNLKFITRSNVASPTYVAVDSGVIPTVGVWYHIVATTEDISGTSIRMTLYLDGNQVAQTTFASRVITDQSQPNNLELGTIITPTPDRFFGGKIDDVRVYNRALSTTEITALYQSYNPGVVVSELQKGLVGQWKMDGNAKDATPNSNHGTVTGATLTTDRKSQSNKAYSFGTSKYITVGSSTSLQVTSAMTMSAWVYGTDDNTERKVIIKNGSYQMRLNPVGESPRFSCFVWIGSVAESRRTTSFADNTWTHYACTYDANGGSNNMKLYKDGVLVDQGTRTGNIDTNSNDVGIGANSSGTNPWNGTVDDVRVYNRALTAAEILALYESYR